MKVLNKIKRKIKYVLVSISMFAMMGLPVFATGNEPIFVSGTKKLIDDITTYLMGFVAAITVVLLIVSLYQWNIAGEEEKPKYKKKAMWTVIIGVLILLASAIVNWVFGYYQ